MDLNTPNNSEITSSIRNLAISRRGGVRTRGGRLPPVNIREITQMSGSKKLVAPNIPQRRKMIKKELETSTRPLIKVEKTDKSESSRGRGRGRQQKVFLQTEGTFLAEGPAMKMKKDPNYDGSFSVLRSSRKVASESCEVKVDTEAIKNLLESDEAGGVYEDDFQAKPPYVLPLKKEKLMRKIKLEPDEDIKDIKKEIEEDETEVKKEIKNEIKREIEEDETEIKMEIKKEIKTELDDEDEEFSSAKHGIFRKGDIYCKAEAKATAEEFQNMKDDGTLVLLQLPKLSADLRAETIEHSSKDKAKQPEKEVENIIVPTFVDCLEEGFIGKLRIMKSGRMKIALGSVEFELMDGNTSESYREVASLQIRDDGSDLAILGKVEKIMLLSPVINTLIPNIDARENLKS